MIQVNALDTIDYVKRCLSQKLVPMIWGSPGIGKSDLAHALSVNYKMELIDIRLSTIEGVDLNGYPKANGEKATYLPFDMFPLEGDKLPPGKRGWIVFLDELTSAVPAVMKAAYKLILDRKIGNFNLHQNVYIICAGNSLTDNAMAHRIGTAMESRLIHIEMLAELEPWLIWANRNDIDPRIIAFLQQSPEHLMMFDPRHNDKTFACPRTWTFASKLIKGTDTKQLNDMLALLMGVVAEKAANAFIVYSSVFVGLPTYADIKKNPLQTVIYDDPGKNFAISNIIAQGLDKKDAKGMMGYINRMPLEFQVVTLQNAIHRRPELFDEQVVSQWAMTIGQEVTLAPM